MTKFFIYPFAISGDRAPVPDDAQIDGSLSYEEGYPIAYQKKLGVDPAARAILRNQYNQVLYDITGVLQQYETHGFPEYITSAQNEGSPYPYDIYSVVRYDPGTGDQLYVSLINRNISLPTNTRFWTPLSQLGNGPSALVQYNGSTPQTITILGHIFSFDTVQFDTNSIFDGSTKFTPTVPGYYRVYGSVVLDNTTLGTSSFGWYLNFLLNGALYDSAGFEFIPSTVYFGGISGGATIPFNGSTDYVQLRGLTKESSGLTVTGQGTSFYFGIDYVRPL